MKKEITISGIAITMVDPEETIGMGGPFAGQFYLGDKFIADKCIMDNFLVQDSDKIFFVRLHWWDNRWLCSLNYFSISENKLYRDRKPFHYLFIKQFLSENRLEIYHSFHNKFPDHKEIIDLDKEDFFVV